VLAHFLLAIRQAVEAQKILDKKNLGGIGCDYFYEYQYFFVL